LELDKKSKGSPSLPTATRQGQEKDILHKDPEEGNNPGYTMMDVDRKMKNVYGDRVHQNPGTHLNGDIADNAIWQERWQQLVSFPSHAYDVPSGAVGKRFVEKVGEELKGIVTHKWNSKQFLVFQVVILQRNRNVKRSRDV
jgi:hypothetical protein